MKDSSAEYGHQRLNRDTLGGTSKTVAEILFDFLDKGTTNLILDNTYETVTSRSKMLKYTAIWRPVTRW